MIRGGVRLFPTAEATISADCTPAPGPDSREHVKTGVEEK
jgi:hypothetical protein